MKPVCRAAKELNKLIERHNEVRPNDQHDPDLNQIIYLIIRLGDSVRSQRMGSWDEVVQGVRRSLPNKLNLIVGYPAKNEDNGKD